MNKDSLRPASFRGIPFFVEDAQGVIGRRKILHEYPKRDKPYSEDMGRKARSYRMNAYVVGPEHEENRDRLIAAIEENPDPGLLVHPVYGQVMVTPEPLEHHVDFGESNVEYLRLEFTEAGENTYPNQSVDTRSAVTSAASTAAETIRDSFSGVFNVSGLPDFVADDAISVAQQAVNSLNSLVSKYSPQEPGYTAIKNQMDVFTGSVSTLVHSPAGYAAELGTLFDMVPDVYDNPSNTFNSYKGLLTFGDDFQEVRETTTTRSAQKRNRALQVSMLKQLALIGMARAATLIDFDSYEDAVALRDYLANLLDDEMLMVGETDDDDTYFGLQEVRARMVADITARGASLERIREIRLNQTLPALVIAYEQYAGIDREEEITSRNRVKHPGFVSAANAVQILI